MKLIRIFMIFVIISLIVGLGCAFNGTSTNEIGKDISQNELSNENIENFFSESNEKAEEELGFLEDENEQEFLTNSNLIESSSKEKGESKNKNENVKTGKKTIEKEMAQEEQQEENNQEIVQEEQQVEEKKEEVEIKQEVMDSQKEEDKELEKLMKQVEYDTYEKCMEIGFERAIEDSVGILGFSCPYIAYKGKIIGYRLQLDYTNPMEN